jgi:hypothetical protein
MTDNVVKLSSVRYPWKEAFVADGEVSTLQVYVNTRTGQAEVVQTNDDGEAIRTLLSGADALYLAETLIKANVLKKRAETKPGAETP